MRTINEARKNINHDNDKTNKLKLTKSHANNSNETIQDIKQPTRRYQNTKAQA